VIRNIVLTHHHIDHVGGLSLLLQSLSDAGSPEPQVHKFPTPKTDQTSGPHILSDEELERQVQDHSGNGSNINWLKEGTVINAGVSTVLKVIHTPGHTSDSISLLLENTGELFCGDTILG
jgi:ribonuclease/clavin/mitogillin